MKILRKIMLMALCATVMVSTTQARPTFNQNTDLLICQYDSKPDPDDIHAQAAAGSMFAHSQWSGVNKYAVQGAYGDQTSKFYDSATLFAMIFGTKNVGWTDAHNDWWGSVARIRAKAKAILQAGGKVWVAEAGQSNITADWIYGLINTDNLAESLVKSNVIVVQHEDAFNERWTTPSDLSYVKSKATYYLIDDGNAPYGLNDSWANHGPYDTPHFKNSSSTYITRAKAASNPNATARGYWIEADAIAQTATDQPWSTIIKDNGVDFSDTVEVWWILEDTITGNNVGGFWDKYVDNTPQGGGTDSVDHMALPASVESATSYTVSVPVEASTSRDVVVEIWDSGWRGQGRTTVSAGSSSASVSIGINNGVALTAGAAHLWKVSIRPVGGDWTTNIDSGSKSFSVTSGGGGSDTIDTAQVPTSIASATSYTLSIPYTTTQNRDLYVELWQGGSWKMGKKVDLDLRSGTASVTLTGTAPVAGTGYFWKLYMTLDGMNWQNQVPNTYTQVNNVTVTSGGTVLSGVFHMKSGASANHLYGYDTATTVRVAPLQTWPGFDWTMEHVSGDVYRLKGNYGNLYLQGSTSGGGEAKTAALNTASDAQKWTLELVSGTTYNLKCNASGQYLFAYTGNWSGTVTLPKTTADGFKWILDQQ